MLENIIFREANKGDIANVVKAIISAEMSGTDVLSYRTILGLNMQQTEQILKDVLLEEVDGCELSLSSFIIAEIDGKFVGTTSAWIEGLTGFQSTQIKGNLLSRHLSLDSLIYAQKYSSELSDMHIKPEMGTIQIGLVFVSELFRGNGISAEMILNHIRKFNVIDHRAVFIQVYRSNRSALKSYEKMGFRHVASAITKSSMEGVLPDNKKYLLKLNKIV